MKVIIPRRAEAEIMAIAAHIERDDPRAAGRWAIATRDLCLRLRDNVERGAVIGSRRGVSVRRLVHGSYLIFYAVERDAVRILRVTHGARSPNSLLKNIDRF